MARSQVNHINKAFYAFSERVDYENEFQRMGFKKSQNQDEWLLKNETYIRLNPWDCFTAFSLVFMRLPEPSYNELLEIALYSRDADEKTASLGVILAKHEKSLIHELGANKNSLKVYKQLMNRVLDLINKSTAKDEFKELLFVCNNLLNSH